MAETPIAILGTPVSSGNRGVLALGASLINLCTRASRGGQVVLMLGNRDNAPAPFRVDGQRCLVPVVHARMSPRTHPRHHLYWILLMAVVYRLVPVRALRSAIARSTPWIRTLEDSALVGDVRGGDSFSDIYGLRRFVNGFLLAWTVLLVRGSMVQFPQTYGPFRHPVARWLARYLLKRSSVIIARDRESQRVARELAGPHANVLLSPDVAFSLDPVLPETVELNNKETKQQRGQGSGVTELSTLNSQLSTASSQESGVRGQETGVSSPLSVVDAPASGDRALSTLNSQLSTTVGLNINGLMFNGGYTRDNMFGLKLDYPTFLTELVVALLREHPGELWLVPHTYAAPESVESDPEACRRVQAGLPPELRDRVRVITGEYDAHELKGIIGGFDFFIGSRMHSCIAALSQGVPCVGVAYSRKFAGVFESVGMEDWVVDARSLDNQAAVARILELYRSREAVRPALKQAADRARAQLTDIFRDLFAGINGERTHNQETKTQSPKPAKELTTKEQRNKGLAPSFFS